MLDSHEMSKTKHGGVLTWNLGTDDEDSSSVDPVNNNKKKKDTHIDFNKLWIMCQ